MVPLDEFAGLLGRLLKIRETVEAIRRESQQLDFSGAADVHRAMRERRAWPAGGLAVRRRAGDCVCDRGGCRAGHSAPPQAATTRTSLFDVEASTMPRRRFGAWTHSSKILTR